MKKLTVILLALALFACDKKKNTSTTKPDIGTILTCFEQTTWNSAKLNSYLSGYWQMNRAFGGWVGEMPIENVKLRFYHSDSLTIYKDGVVLSTSKYHIDSSGNNIYEVVTDSFTQYTPGRVMYCSNQIVFNSSFVDGNDYYYAKVSK